MYRLLFLATFRRSPMSESTITLADPHLALQLFGPNDNNLRLVRNQLGVAITHRNGQIRIAGPMIPYASD